MKRCTGCLLDLPVTEFYRCASSKDGLQWRCKPCRRAHLAANRERTRERSRAYRAENPEVTRRPLPNVRSRVKLTPVQYDALLEAQGRVCAICHRLETALSRAGKPLSLAVDHDHATEQIRGLLCNRCNRGLGSFLDDASLLRAAADYLAGAAQRRRPSGTSSAGDGCASRSQR